MQAQAGAGFESVSTDGYYCLQSGIYQAYTLVQAMLGGISWGEVSDLLMEIDVSLIRTQQKSKLGMFGPASIYAKIKAIGT